MIQLVEIFTYIDDRKPIEKLMINPKGCLFGDKGYISKHLTTIRFQYFL
ncbi:MAG: transposase [Holosporales bacterium]|jgi:hypothetical protein|nr:transposase [Holosporales bacterium]